MKHAGGEHDHHNAVALDRAAATLVAEATEQLTSGTGFGKIRCEVYWSDGLIRGFDVETLKKFKPGE